MLTKEKKFVKIHKRKKVFKIADKRKKGNFRKEVIKMKFNKYDR